MYNGAEHTSPLKNLITLVSTLMFEGFYIVKFHCVDAAPVLFNFPVATESSDKTGCRHPSRHRWCSFSSLTVLQVA